MYFNGQHFCFMFWRSQIQILIMRLAIQSSVWFYFCTMPPEKNIIIVSNIMPLLQISTSFAGHYYVHILSFKDVLCELLTVLLTCKTVIHHSWQYYLYILIHFNYCFFIMFKTHTHTHTHTHDISELQVHMLFQTMAAKPIACGQSVTHATVLFCLQGHLK